jgi:hypothetical protein
MVDWQASDGLESITDSLANYMRDFYPTLTVKTPTQIELDKEKAVAVVTTIFDIPEAWDPDPEEGLKYFTVRPYEIRSDMPQFSGAARTTPFGISYPEATRQTLEVKASNGYSFDDDDHEYVSDAFVFKELDRFDKDASIYTEIYTYQAKRDYISEDNFRADMAAIEDIRDRLGITVHSELESVSSSTKGGNKISAVLTLLALLGFLAWLFLFQGKAKRKDV